MLEPIKGMWKEKRVSVCIDGWLLVRCAEEANHRFLGSDREWINILECCKCKESYKEQLLYCRQAHGLHQRGWISKCGAIITDNAHACKSAGVIVESSHPHI